ncbi:Uu.00g002150.m01.CDS01 [Anthostomella pinea]|uniref:Uu.00g002150.m01.CDS01 n=1 Tax=Anthostomella pinea TaxID=933095 RepID=A0AAI8VKN1_9PEZI|nr:Uu.00g002150.m01.CDS01 [Anthostomella pinea]
MAPKKKEAKQTMSLGAFLHDENFGGSWADEVEDTIGSQPLPSSGARTGYSTYGSSSADRPMYSTREYPTQLPTRPPYTAHLGNLSYEANSESVTDFFADCEITSVRIIEDRIEQRPKGFAYAEFASLDGLKKALTLDGTSFDGRTIKVRIADPPKDRDGRSGDSARDLSSWERKGPLMDMPSRSNDRRPTEFGGERRGPPRDGPVDDGKVRDFGNWERKGPLSPVAQPERSASREGGRPRTNDGNRADSFRTDRKPSPATWGEGRQEGSRPPREFRDRPERSERPDRPDRPERAPTAAEKDNQWRSNMRPDRAAKSPEQSRDGSEAPPSPAGSGPAAPAAPVGRPRLNLIKRTVSEAPDVTSPGLSSAGGDAKASPFGAARPIDTAAKEREIADKRDQAVKEKKEADDQAKEERRLAKEAAAKEAAEKEAADAEKAKADALKEKTEVPAEVKEEPKETSAEEPGAKEQKMPARPKQGVENPKSRANDSGNWRTASGEQRQGRGGYVNAPRGRGDARGRGAPRGPRGNMEGRPPRANGSSPVSTTATGTASAPQQPAAPASATSATSPGPDAEEAPKEPDGWTTVPPKGRRGGRA